MRPCAEQEMQQVEAASVLPPAEAPRLFFGGSKRRRSLQTASIEAPAPVVPRPRLLSDAATTTADGLPVTEGAGVCEPHVVRKQHAQQVHDATDSGFAIHMSIRISILSCTSVCVPSVSLRR